MVPDQINDIEVEEEARGQGVGKELFQYVLGRTQSMGYQEVLVLGSHKNSKKFYQLMLEGLKQSNQIRGYDMFPMKDVGYESWNFRIKI
jgi:GNAT superfamily N-acetyltransferase